MKMETDCVLRHCRMQRLSSDGRWAVPLSPGQSKNPACTERTNSVCQAGSNQVARRPLNAASHDLTLMMEMWPTIFIRTNGCIPHLHAVSIANFEKPLEKRGYRM